MYEANHHLTKSPLKIGINVNVFIKEEDSAFWWFIASQMVIKLDNHIDVCWIDLETIVIIHCSVFYNLQIR
jgi:hypothetical protein